MQQAAMARFPSLCLRLFASGVVLATAFSLQAPIQQTATRAQGTCVRESTREGGKMCVK